MGRGTTIGWTDDTFNPWWGCDKVSPGCDFCYADEFSGSGRGKRITGGVQVWGKHGPRHFFGDRHWAEPRRWRGKVLCASMCDVFEPHPDVVEERKRLWRLINETPRSLGSCRPSGLSS